MFKTSIVLLLASLFGMTNVALARVIYKEQEMNDFLKGRQQIEKSERTYTGGSSTRLPPEGTLCRVYKACVSYSSGGHAIELYEQGTPSERLLLEQGQCGVIVIHGGPIALDLQGVNTATVLLRRYSGDHSSSAACLRPY